MRRPAARAGGLTLIELSLALAGLAIISVAVTAMGFAATSAWSTREAHREQTRAARLVADHLGRWVRSAERVVATHAVDGRTHLVLWTDDDYFPGEVNLAELKVLSFDAATGTLTLYAAELTDAQKSGSANVALDPVLVGGSGFAASFAARSDTQAFPLAENIIDMTVTVRGGEADYDFAYVQLQVAGADAAPDQLVTCAGRVRAPETAVVFAGGGG